ncbi:MAG: radical SAM protein [Clostridiales bacterium]|nr:radical SAM protein [Clostridiales bacterium]
MANNYVYILDGKAYVNLTNKCSNACTFCIRNTGDGVKGTPLWLDKEPTAIDVISAFEKVRDKLASDEVVFCGFGEPTDAMAVLVESAARLKGMGYTLRLNTNGLGNADNGRDITSELKVFDTVSVSLNQCDAKKYAEVTRSRYEDKAFSFVLDFAKSCKERGINTVFTVVDTIDGGDVDRCREIARKMGVPLRVRSYVPDNYGDN